MKKVFFSTALVLTLLGFWAFRPKVIAPAQYLMVIRELDRTDLSEQPKPALTVIEPDGTFKTEELPVIASNFPRKSINATIVKGTTVDSTSTRLRRFRYARNYIYQAEVRKLNELSAQGWSLVSTTQEGVSTRYLLRKE
ncbi:hypothetical protein [Hymenobacter arizonensis]|uniref:DUF4177 domain-containing protein n=1 Tax=Hymenobacter arizonensis TaxID=1227077 RepID=A0A1I5WIP8_HYMAR|nr:hypothetical protein [Hymenobacter arizonensis]SFQ19501.1 hypothetical protein SAMN04515668_1339 [Hymenobacter arizonensis]